MLSLSSPTLSSYPNHSSRYLSSRRMALWERSGWSEKQRLFAGFCALCSVAFRWKPLLSTLFLHVLLIFHLYLHFSQSWSVPLEADHTNFIIQPLAFWLLLGFGHWEAVAWDGGQCVAQVHDSMFGHLVFLSHSPPCFGVWALWKVTESWQNPGGIGWGSKKIWGCTPGGIVDSKLDIKFNERELSNIFFPRIILHTL